MKDKSQSPHSNTQSTGIEEIPFANTKDSEGTEIERLKATLKDILASATRNQKTQERFFELELHFLQSRSIESLLARILTDLKTKLQLSQVELILIDPEHEIRRLIQEIYGELDFQNLKFVDDFAAIKPFYSGPIHLKLSQNSSTIKRLFAGQPALSKSIAQLPLMRGNNILGSLHLGSRDLERFHRGLATNFLQHLSSIISVCLENSVNQEKYVHLSLVDMLTRAKNRRYFFQALTTEIARATRSDSQMAVLFLDIDHFKSINDLHGHFTGDRALRAVADGILPLLRKSDTLARFGGEEFTVLLPNCSKIEALEIAERIRQQVAQLLIEAPQQQTLSLTISIGVSHWDPVSQHFKDPEACQNYLINTADKAVYLAKSGGRNCVKQISLN